MSQFCKSLLLRSLVALVAVLSCTNCTYPKGYIYANNASNNAPYIYKIDLATGQVVAITNLSSTIGPFGIGVAVIGNTRSMHSI